MAEIKGLIMPTLNTIRSKWNPENRAAVAADDTLVTASATTMKHASLPAYTYKPEELHNALEIAWTMAADAQACAVYVFAARKSGDIVQVYTATITAGKQVATDLRYWVDTIASSTDTWITTVKEIDNGGSDRQARIVLDTCGYESFFCQYTGLLSESVQAHYSGY